MSSPAETVESPRSDAGPRAPRIRLSNPAVPAIASGLLLFFAFPIADRGYIAWFALVPLLSLVRSTKRPIQVYLGAWAGGLAFWLLSVIWIWSLHPSAWVAWLALAAYQSVYWPLFLLLTRVMVNRQRLPLMLAAPVAWVGLEYVQAFALSGFPWYYLAHSQYRYLPLIQVADLFGTWAISFLVMMGNAWLAQLLTLPSLTRTGRGTRPTRALVVRTLVFAAALAGTLGYGAYRLGEARFAAGPRVALLQSHIDQEMKTHSDPNAILAVYAGLSRKARRESEVRFGGRPPDLVVWPETSYAGGQVWIEPGLKAGEIDRLGRSIFPESSGRDWLDRMSDVIADLTDWSRAVGSPMLVGTILYEVRSRGAERSNAAVLVDPEADGPFPVYRKIHLVPFGEYVPLLDVIPWIARLTPYENEALPMLTGGKELAWFDSRGVRYATAICFEDTVPHLVRRFFSEAPGGRAPDVLVNISNDGWFRGSAEHDMHLAIGIFRAVENRVPVIRAVNSGVSAVVDGNGRILRQLPKLTEGVLVEAVPLDPRTSFYTRVAGDTLGQSCLAASLGLMVMALAGFPRRRAPVRGSVPSP